MYPENETMHEWQKRALKEADQLLAQFDEVEDVGVRGYFEASPRFEFSTRSGKRITISVDEAGTPCKTRVESLNLFERLLRH
jgi:hypothetical protein